MPKAFLACAAGASVLGGLGAHFNYFSTHDFHVNKDISACLSNNAFSFLNCNIRSIQANIDNLINMLSELYFPLSIIGLTET